MTAMMMMAAIVTPVQVEKSLPLFFFFFPRLVYHPSSFHPIFSDLAGPWKENGALILL